jgi:hypothetical protein
MTTTGIASPDRRGGTSISKYEDVEVGHWFRSTTDRDLAITPVEVLDLEWSQAANGCIVYVRQHGATSVIMQDFNGWRKAVRPCLPPWAE